MKKRNMKNDKPAYYYYKHNCSSFLGSSSRKFLTYVTKTRPNLATYSRKLGNYNGTIIFEIDIMKNLSPINLNLCGAIVNLISGFLLYVVKFARVLVRTSFGDMRETFTSYYL